MSSGYGLTGEGRCYKTFKIFEKCMAEEENSRSECYELRQNYFNCLHHKPLLMFFEPHYMLERRDEVDFECLTHKLIGLSRLDAPKGKKVQIKGRVGRKEKVPTEEDDEEEEDREEREQAEIDAELAAVEDIDEEEAEGWDENPFDYNEEDLK